MTTADLHAASRRVTDERRHPSRALRQHNWQVPLDVASLGDVVRSSLVNPHVARGAKTQLSAADLEELH
jgi:hypothetical protein